MFYVITDIPFDHYQKKKRNHHDLGKLVKVSYYYEKPKDEEKQVIRIKYLKWNI